MDIRSGLDGLKTILGVTPAGPTAPDRIKGGHTAESSLNSDSATVSSAASEVALTAGEGGVRADKVAAVQAALAAGTYEVPASAVASRVIDSMLGRGQ
ncbi:MAG TPA: flagellar biosynthesis anti-sigma factor FlgM [Terracidiphilus sp.]|jgi:negative regulator of flagellin synthesis FlgM